MDDLRDHRIEVSINRSITNKMPADSEPADWGRYNLAWEFAELTAHELAVEVWRGNGFSAVFQNNRRKKMYFARAHHVALDFDCGDERAKISTLMEDDIINSFSSFLYYTPSSSAGAYKSRVVFVLQTPLYFVEEYEELQNALAWRFPHSDQATAEAARLFYGSKGAELLGNWSILPTGVVAELVRQWREVVPVKAPRPPVDPNTIYTADNVAPRRLQGLLDSLLANVRTAPHGERHNTLLRVATALGGYVAGGYYDRTSVEELLLQAILSNNGHERDIMVVRQGLDFGQQAPLYFTSEDSQR